MLTAPFLGGVMDEVTAGLTPSPAQLEWQRDGIGAFFHIGVNTFNGQEWSDGTDSPSIFAPTDLDTDQWLRAAVSFGARYAVLTAKHHDGFCLWPTRTTSYSVASSPWRGGGGDVVGEFVASCRRFGVKPGLYLSPWDRNASVYDDPAGYDEFYLAQLAELLTGYGELSELWFDGAGSENRSYDWDRIDALCDELQPQALRFNMGDFHIRWVGNEDGLAADPVEYVVSATPTSVRSTDARDVGGLRYAPPECDVSLRPGWFFHDMERPKELGQLMQIYHSSVGLGANLLLNLPPDRRGLIADDDVERCAEFGAEIGRLYGSPETCLVTRVSDDEWVAHVPAGAPVTAIEVDEDLTRGQRIRTHLILAADAGPAGMSRDHPAGSREPEAMSDHRASTRALDAAPDDTASAQLAATAPDDIASAQESRATPPDAHEHATGARASERELASGGTIGISRIHRLAEPQTLSRLVIMAEAVGRATLSSVAVHRTP